MVRVLTGLWTGQYDRIVRWWSSKPQSGIATVLDSSAYYYVLLPRLTCNFIPHHSYHTRSFTHLGVTSLLHRISSYCTGSFAHPGVSRLSPRIPTSLSVSPPPYGSSCVTLSLCRLLLLASHETPAKVAQSCFSVAYRRHQASLLIPPPVLPMAFSPAHASNISHKSTHCSTVVCRLPI